MGALAPVFGAEGLETADRAFLADPAEHAVRIRRAKRSGYLHQKLHLVSGLNDRVVRSVPKGAGMYLVGEGQVVHEFDKTLLEERGVRVVTMDRDLPAALPDGVDAQIRCDLCDIAGWTRRGMADLDFGGAPDTLVLPEDTLPAPGSFVASHIGRYLPAADTAALLDAGMDALPEGGNIWVIDTPFAARANKAGGSPGFDEAYRLAGARGDVRIAVDEVIAPTVDLGLYYRLERMRAARPGSDDAAFFDAVHAQEVRFDALPAARANEAEFRVKTGRRSVRVNGWGIRAMMLEKR